MLAASTPGRLVRILRGHLPEADTTVILAAAENAGPAATALNVALWLEGPGAGWFTEPERGSAAFGRIYDSLRKSGLPLEPRRCGRCRKATTLPILIDGLRCCHRCYTQSRQIPCSSCGRTAFPVRRQPDGSLLCFRCKNQLADQSAPCISCHRHRQIAIRTHLGPLCAGCRSREFIDTCRSCGRPKPCRAPFTEEATCRHCALTRVTCSQCGNHRLPYRLTDGGAPLCRGCARGYRRICTDCSQHRRLCGLINDLPYCPTCYKKDPGSFHDCARCGTHAYLDRHQLCPRCQADDLINGLVTDPERRRDPAIAAFLDACRAGDTTLTLSAFGRHASTEILRKVLTQPKLLTHSALDQIGSEVRTRYARSLLVQHGLLPPRNENLARLETWITNAAATIEELVDARIFLQYARWKHLRTLRDQKAPIRQQQCAYRRHELRTILSLLAHTHSRGQTLETLTQDTVDLWRLRHKSTQRLGKAFLTWARRNGRTCEIDFDLPRRPDTNLAAPAEPGATLELVSRIFTDTQTPASVRFAAALVLLYGIRVHRIAALRLSDITEIDRTVSIKLGKDPLLLSTEIGSLATITISDRDAPRLFGPAKDPIWLFPGTTAGNHCSPYSLRERLIRFGIQPTLNRSQAMMTLATHLPAPVLSRLTGLRPVTAAKWAATVSASDSIYAAEQLAPLHREHPSSRYSHHTPADQIRDTPLTSPGLRAPRKEEKPPNSIA